MAMLAMTILVHFSVVYWATHCTTYMHPKAQPAALHCSLSLALASWHILVVWAVHGTFYVV